MYLYYTLRALPPSIPMVWPVMNLAPSLARKAIMPATSSTVPIRPSGWFLLSSSISCSNISPVSPPWVPRSFNGFILFFKTSLLKYFRLDTAGSRRSLSRPYWPTRQRNTFRGKKMYSISGIQIWGHCRSYSWFIVWRVVKYLCHLTSWSNAALLTE